MLHSQIHNEKHRAIYLSKPIHMYYVRHANIIGERTPIYVDKALIGGGGGGAYSYIRVLPDEFLLKSTVMTTDFKRNSSGRTRIYEYPPPSKLTL